MNPDFLEMFTLEECLRDAFFNSDIGTQKRIENELRKVYNKISRDYRGAYIYLNVEAAAA